MAQECGFFNAQLVGEEYDRVYLAEQFAAYFASFIGNGIFGSSMQQLEVVANDDMTINILSGQAWINGWWYRNTDVYTLSHSVADGILSRTDIVVLRWDHSARDMYLAVIEGTPSVKPIKPAIVRNADFYDLQLCEVSIPAGSIRITQAQITDTRLDNDVCGLVTGVVDQIDTTSLFSQFMKAYQEWKDNQQANYEDWTDVQKTAYNKFIADTEGDYTNFVNQSRQNYTNFVEESEQEYTDYTTGKQTEFNNWYTTYLAEFQTAIETWFENMKGQISEDAAVNLQLQIDNLEGAASEAWADGKTIVAENGKLRTNKIYEEHVTEESLEEYPTGEKYIDMDIYTEPGFYQFDAFSSSVIGNNVPFETGFLLIVGKGGLYDSREHSYGDVFYQEAITNNGRKYRFGNGIGTSASWGTWRTEGEIDGYAEVVNSASGTNIVFTANISAPKFNGTATKAALLSTQNVNKDANTSAFTGSTVVEEYSASGSSNLPGDGDCIVMTMCGSTNLKAASVAVTEGDGRLYARGRLNGWKGWNRYIHEADIARKGLFNGSLDVGGGVQTLEDDITQYKTVGFLCGRGEQYYHGTMFFGYSTGARHTIPVGKGYITVTSASPTQIEVLENTTGYALRQIWGKKV